MNPSWYENDVVVGLPEQGESLVSIDMNFRGQVLWEDPQRKNLLGCVRRRMTTINPPSLSRKLLQRHSPEVETIKYLPTIEDQFEDAEEGEETEETHHAAASSLERSIEARQKNVAIATQGYSTNNSCSSEDDDDDYELEKLFFLVAKAGQEQQGDACQDHRKSQAPSCKRTRETEDNISDSLVASLVRTRQTLPPSLMQGEGEKADRRQMLREEAVEYLLHKLRTRQVNLHSALPQQRSLLQRGGEVGGLTIHQTPQHDVVTSSKKVSSGLHDINVKIPQTCPAADSVPSQPQMPRQGREPTAPQPQAIGTENIMDRLFETLHADIVTTFTTKTSHPFGNNVVICGKRGNALRSNRYPGNLLFIKVIRACISDYIAAPTRAYRSVVVTEVVTFLLKKVGMIFMSYRVDDNGAETKELVKWSLDQVYCKVSHAIRDRLKQISKDSRKSKRQKTGIHAQARRFQTCRLT